MKHSGALLLCTVVAAVAFGGCGGDGPASESTSNTPVPTPTPTAIPSQFTGNYAGTVALDTGRTGAVSLAVQNDTHTTGTLTISGGGMPDMVVPITGFVDLIGGTFSLSGSSDIVSGTLPSTSSGTGFLSVQIGTNTTPFHGTIQRA